MASKVLLFIALLFAALAIGIWVVFLKPVPVQTSSGKIAKETFKPAGVYWQYPTGIDRGFRTATPIPLSEAYVFELRLEGTQSPIFFSLNTVASQAFYVGQKVRIRYRERSIPFLWKRVYVIDMTAID